MATKISVIVPCYNQAQFLDQCLQSVLDQTYQDWECIIVNDGSPDNTEDVAKKWQAKDKRFRYIYKENGGLSSARNAGIQIADGEWVLLLDCDDYIGNTYLELASGQFSESKIIYCKGAYFGDKTGSMDLPKYDFKSLLVKNSIFCTFFFQRKHYDLVNGYDENFKEGYEDWDFLMRLIHYNQIQNVYQIPETLFFYRIKNQSMLKDVENKYKRLRQQIYNKNKSIYDLYYKDHYSILIYDNFHLKQQSDLYKTKLSKIYSNPIFKLYFFIQNLIHGKK